MSSGDPRSADVADPTPGSTAPPASDAADRRAAALELPRRLLEGDATSVIVATVLLIVVIGIFHPGFFSASQLKQVLQEAVYVGIIACGMAFLVAMRDIDLTKIESRPLKTNPISFTTAGDRRFRYLFFIDAAANLADDNTQNALRHLQEMAGYLRVLGCYPVGKRKDKPPA